MRIVSQERALGSFRLLSASLAIAATSSMIGFGYAQVSRTERPFDEADPKRYNIPSLHSSSTRIPEAIILVTKFEQAQWTWWRDGETGSVPIDGNPDYLRAMQKTLSRRDQVLEVINANVPDLLLQSRIEVFAVEAIGEWMCADGIGCYPKGVMLGAEVATVQNAQRYCDVLNDVGHFCAVANDPFRE